MTNAKSLYRSILRVHRRLPQEMRFVGDQYVRAEFRSHRKVTDKQFLKPFFAQWSSYLTLLRKQTGAGSPAQSQESHIGKHLDPELVERLDDDKAEQLLELHQASTGANREEGSAATAKPSATSAPPPRRV